MLKTENLPAVGLHIGDSQLTESSGGTCRKTFPAAGELQADIQLLRNKGEEFARLLTLDNATPAGTPLGGQGLSGFGREGGRHGIEEFIRTKTVAIGGWYLAPGVERH